MDAAREAGESESLRHLLSLAALLANLGGEYEKANELLEEAATLAPATESPMRRKKRQGAELSLPQSQSREGARARQHGAG